ncbi:hypothetical protein HOLleu_25488 [Holothuria leucospilota]|uniref:Uncharacterized protein n=1 Tax=Holothuria leucospilota TaxID=206669 RepID=A0A9Q1H4D9_HOLLE|nr:hypothetical protein HOLleu_25488 [Holothuria leucospilota]
MENTKTRETLQYCNQTMQSVPIQKVLFNVQASRGFPQQAFRTTVQMQTLK